MSLNDKILSETIGDWIEVKDVKEFIKRRDEIDDKLFKGEIDWVKHMEKKLKLAGDLK